MTRLVLNYRGFEKEFFEIPAPSVNNFNDMIFMNKSLELLKKNYPNPKHYINFSNPLELLVATILSAQVRDNVVNSCTITLFKKYKTAKDYSQSDQKELESIILPSFVEIMDIASAHSRNSPVGIDIVLMVGSL